MHVFVKSSCDTYLVEVEVVYDRACEGGQHEPVALEGFILLLGVPAHLPELALRDYHSLLLLIMIRALI
jgi:hypothetical protein